MVFHPPQSAIRCHYCQKPVRQGAAHKRCMEARQKREQEFIEKSKNSRPFFTALLTRKDGPAMVWKITLTSRGTTEEPSYYEFEDQLMAIGFFLKSFFLGNYSKLEVEFVQKSLKK